MEKGKMRRVQRFLRTVGEKAKEVLTHKSKGYNDVVTMVSVIISMVIFAVIVVGYILPIICETSNYEYKYPLLVVVAILFAFIIVSVILRQLAS